MAQTYGRQPWILQCMEGVQQCVQNSIEMLSGQPVQANNQTIHQGGQYQFPARTAEELQATQREAALAGNVTPASPQQKAAQQQAEAALAAGQLDMFAALQAQAGTRDPATQGVAQEEVPSEPGSDKWIV